MENGLRATNKKGREGVERNTFRQTLGQAIGSHYVPFTKLTLTSCLYHIYYILCFILYSSVTGAPFALSTALSTIFALDVPSFMGSHTLGPVPMIEVVHWQGDPGSPSKRKLACMCNLASLGG